MNLKNHILEFISTGLDKSLIAEFQKQLDKKDVLFRIENLMNASLNTKKLKENKENDDIIKSDNLHSQDKKLVRKK